MLVTESQHQNSVRFWIYRLIGFAVVVRVFEDLLNRQWQIFEGTIFPMRHFDLVPLMPLWGAVLLWTLQLVAGVGLAFSEKHRVWFARFAALILFVSLTQAFQNQKTLLFLICLYLSIGLQKGREQDAFKAMRWQLILVYLFSFVHKIMDAFWTGEVIRSLCLFLLPTTWGPRHFILSVIEPLARPFSIFVLAVEVIAPILLMSHPRLGIAVVIFLHAGLALAMPDVTTFALAMIALALTFEFRKSYD